MPAIAILGSVCSGHGSWPPRSNVSGQGSHTVNGAPVHCVGDAWAPHTEPSAPETHGSVTASGQSLHTINGKPVARIGDAVACGSVIVTGQNLHEVS